MALDRQMHDLAHPTVDDLRKLSIFSELPDETLEKLAPGVEFVHLTRGEMAFKTGDSARHLYFVCRGKMKIYYSSIEGREQILYIYDAGDYVGGLNIIKDADYRYVGEALEDCILAVIHRSEFEKYALTHRSVLMKMLEKTYERIRWGEELIMRLSTNNALIKSSTLLLQLANEFGVQTSKGIRLDLTMSREELGSYAGLTRETITRKLSEFKEMGYIDFLGPRTVLIKNPEALRKICM